MQNQERIRRLGEKVNEKYMGIYGDERKNKQRVPQTNEKTSRNTDVVQKPHQRNKQQGDLTCKTLKTILKMDKKRTQKN